jgi:hypothetical protein
VAAEVLWGAVLDRREIPADRIIALLCYRLSPPDEYEDNLVWSITSELRGIDYLSDYNPYHDPLIQRELEAIRMGG